MTNHRNRILTIGLGLIVATAVLARAQEPELVATFTAKKDVPVIAAWAPDGHRLAYGTERELKPRNARPDDEDVPRFYPGEVWLVDIEKPDKKPKRLLDYREVGALEYRIEDLNWSPDGETLAAELTHPTQGTEIHFFTEKGKLERIGGRRNYVRGYGGGWMGDSLNFGFLEEAYPPRVLHQVWLVRMEGGRVVSRFPNDLFAAVAWLPGHDQVAAIRRDREFSEPPELILGTFADGSVKSLGDIPDYQGRLALVPGEEQVSYFVSAEELAVRPLVFDAIHTTLPVPMGPYKWSPDGDAVYYLEAEEIGDPTGRLRRIDRKTREDVPVLSETIWDFWLSPDGSHVAVLTAGAEPVLRVYRLK